MKNQSMATRRLEPFVVNDVRVEPSALRLSSRLGECSVEPKVMALLIALADRPGELWLRTDLIDELWHDGRGSDETLTRIVSILRKALGATHGVADVLATVPKLGYRLDATVQRQQAKRRIAVLPFRSLTTADDQGYFADGIADELITRLAQTAQFLVTGRTSSFHFKNSDMSLPDIARTLHVAHLIEGSVQHQQEQVRIDIRLIDGETGFETWSYRYDGTLDDIFVSRDDVARAVLDGIAKALNLAGQPPKAPAMTNNKAAYDLYLQGRALTSRAIGDGVLSTAIDLLEQALALDPDFAKCWTALAEAHCYTAVFTPCLDRMERSAQMAECARKAIALDSKQGHARALLGIHKWTQNDIVGALDLAFAAYKLEPDNPAVAMRLGSFLLYCGRTQQAMPYIEAAIDQDPVDGRNYAMLCVAHLNNGDIDASIRAGQRMVDLGMPSMWLAVATAASGAHDQAVEHYWRTRLLMNKVIFPPAGTDPMTPEAMDAYWLVAAKGVCSGQDEDRKKYCQMLEMLHLTFPDPCDTSIVAPAIWMGFAEMVFKTVGARITPANMYVLNSIWADVEPIRQTRLHAGFMDFADRIGLTTAWEKYGWPDLLPKPALLPDPERQNPSPPQSAYRRAARTPSV